MKEEGIKVVIINSNPATITTDPVIADQIYLLPLTFESITHILQEQKIDAVLPTMGVQSALNLCKEVEQRGLWGKYDVRIIGVDIEAIERTENREEFRKSMIEIGVAVAKSKISNSFLEGKEAAQEIGFTLAIRPSYTLGGTGRGFFHTKEEIG